jgi:hypothetical protein
MLYLAACNFQTGCSEFTDQRLGGVPYEQTWKSGRNCSKSAFADSKHWPEYFNHDSIFNSAVLDRILNEAEVSLIEGKSFRAKDQIDT